MKNTGLWLAAWLASAAVLSAEPFTVEVLVRQNQFIVGEPIPIAVRLVNHSGQTVHFGDEPWVGYSVEGLDSSVVAQTGEAPIAHNFDVESSKMATLRTDLQPYFNLTKAGLYKVTATVNLKDWGAEAKSESKTFEIIRGIKLWEQEFGMPRVAGAAKGPPEVRKYSLQRATYMKRMRLYLRVTDPSESKFFKIITLGSIVSFGNPRTQLDSQNNLHLLYEESARAYTYIVANPEGDLLVRQTYNYTDSAPRFDLDDAGKIIVVGGVRRVTSTDLPAPQPATSSHDLSPPKTP